MGLVRSFQHLSALHATHARPRRIRAWSCLSARGDEQLGSHQVGGVAPVAKDHLELTSPTAFGGGEYRPLFEEKLT